MAGTNTFDEMQVLLNELQEKTGILHDIKEHNKCFIDFLSDCKKAMSMVDLEYMGDVLQDNRNFIHQLNDLLGQLLILCSRANSLFGYDADVHVYSDCLCTSLKMAENETRAALERNGVLQEMDNDLMCANSSNGSFQRELFEMYIQSEKAAVLCYCMLEDQFNEFAEVLNARIRDIVNSPYMDAVYAPPEFMGIYNKKTNFAVPTMEQQGTKDVQVVYPLSYAENKSRLLDKDETCKFCNNCGNAVPMSARFCPYCGAGFVKSGRNNYGRETFEI